MLVAVLLSGLPMLSGGPQPTGHQSQQVSCCGHPSPTPASLHPAAVPSRGCIVIEPSVVFLFKIVSQLDVHESDNGHGKVSPDLQCHRFD